MDRGTFTQGQSANLSKLTGEMKTSTVMGWSGPMGARADQKFEGQASLELDQAQAKGQADITYANFKNAVQAAMGSQKDPAKDPSVATACSAALKAEAAAAMLGVELRQSVDLAASLGLI